MIVVAIIGLLAAIAVPNYVRARTTSQKNTCMAILRQFDGAAQTWALENNKSAGNTYTWEDIKPYLKLDSLGEITGCPASGVYAPGPTVGNPPTCTALGHGLL